MEELPISVPQLGVVEAVTVVEWLIADGDPVEAGQAVVIIETEKAETELEAPAPGRLRIRVEADPDREIPVGTVLAGVVTEP